MKKKLSCGLLALTMAFSSAPALLENAVGVVGVSADEQTQSVTPAITSTVLDGLEEKITLKTAAQEGDDVSVEISGITFTAPEGYTFEKVELTLSGVGTASDVATIAEIKLEGEGTGKYTLTAKTAGTIVITATAKETVVEPSGDQEEQSAMEVDQPASTDITATWTIVISDAASETAYLNGLTLTTDATGVEVNDAVTLVVAGKDQDGEVFNLTELTVDYAVTLGTDTAADTDYTLSGTTFTPLKAGTFKIIASVGDGESKVSSKELEIVVTVGKTEVSIAGVPDDVTLDKANTDHTNDLTKYATSTGVIALLDALDTTPTTLTNAEVKWSLTSGDTFTEPKVGKYVFTAAITGTGADNYELDEAYTFTLTIKETLDVSDKLDGLNGGDDTDGDTGLDPSIVASEDSTSGDLTFTVGETSSPTVEFSFEAQTSDTDFIESIIGGSTEIVLDEKLTGELGNTDVEIDGETVETVEVKSDAITFTVENGVTVPAMTFAFTIPAVDTSELVAIGLFDGTGKLVELFANAASNSGEGASIISTGGTKVTAVVDGIEDGYSVAAVVYTVEDNEDENNNDNDNNNTNTDTDTNTDDDDTSDALTDSDVAITTVTTESISASSFSSYTKITPIVSFKPTVSYDGQYINAKFNVQSGGRIALFEKNTSGSVKEVSIKESTLAAMITRGLDGVINNNTITSSSSSITLGFSANVGSTYTLAYVSTTNYTYSGGSSVSSAAYYDSGALRINGTYITELRNVLVGEMINLNYYNVINGKEVLGWYYDEALTREITNPSQFVVTSDILANGIYAKLTTTVSDTLVDGSYNAGAGTTTDNTYVPSTVPSTIAKLLGKLF